jgi:hypothetical protein
MKKAIIFGFLSILASLASAQNDSLTTKTLKEKVNLDSLQVLKLEVDSATKDSILVYEFEEFIFRDFSTPEQRAAYRKLVYNVKKTLPYAKLAAFRLQMMEDNLELLTTQKEKEQYIKETEKAIKEEFMATLKTFSKSQGLLLIKLIHRESGNTTYEILKGYRGNVELFYWNMFAKMYDADLKTTYDPILDYQIEMIIKAYNLE